MIDIQKLSTGQRIQSGRHEAIVSAVYYQGGEWRADIRRDSGCSVYLGLNNFDLERWELTR